MFTRRQILSTSLLAPLVALLPSAAQARISTAAKKTKVCSLTAIPVGTGKVFTVGGAPYLISQPKKGTFKAFYAACTHQGCALPSPVAGTMTCFCHSARFDALTGKNLAGTRKHPQELLPNLSAVPAIQVTTDKTSVYLTV